jgi:hypothetical protein
LQVHTPTAQAVLANVFVALQDRARMMSHTAIPTLMAALTLLMLLPAFIAVLLAVS